ncbi:MAG: DUF945 family protein, partial [Saezia sp.]
MKKLLKIIVFLALVYVGASFALSFYAQRAYEKRLAVVEQELAAYNMKIVEQNYDRGIFSSRAYIAVALPLNDLIKDENRLYLDSKVFSGPWLGGFNFGLAKIDTMISFTAVDTSKSLENQYIGV